MKFNEKWAIGLLKLKFTSQPHVIEHSIAVSRKAVEIAERIKKKGVNVDVRLVKIGGLLHDIGRSVTHGIKHGYYGSLILRSLGCYKLARIAERHIGAGITKEEAEKLGLPKRDFIPKTLEEKIVAYADKFVGTTLIFSNFEEENVYRKTVVFPTIKPTIIRFQQELGKDHPAVKRLIELDEEMKGLMYRRFKFSFNEK